MYITKTKPDVPYIFEDGSVPVLGRLNRSFNNPHWFSNAHVHGDTELVFIAKGKAVFTINQRPFNVEAGDILVVEKGFIHSTVSNEEDPSDIFSFSIADYQIRGLEKDHILVSPDILPVMKAGVHEEYLKYCWKELKIYQNMETELAASICESIVIGIATLYYSLFLGQEERYEIPAPHFTQDILIYIYQHYRENITLERLSNEFHMSSGHISHEFSKVFGISPINYAINLKMDQAKWRLLQYDRSLVEIADEIGYQNVQHFCKIFQKRTGYTPLEFKNLYTHTTKKL